MIEEFLSEVTAIYNTGVAREHAYRPALQKLFNACDQEVRAINEPARVDVGAPDFVFLRGDIPIGHCEAKDIDSDLKVMKGYAKDQKRRYTEGFQNLIYTNCLDWRFYREGELIAEITVADFLMGIQPRPERFGALEEMLRDFVAQKPQTITSSRRLAERMAGKALLIRDVLANSLIKDNENGTETELTSQYLAFKQHLIHDISLGDFADIYAETIAYGMFAARLHDETLENFSRQEALDLLPKSNPFLRNLFSYIAGPNLDYRIVWIIDDLAKLFQATDVRKIMARFGNTTQRNDPFLHFYEDFLASYNPKKREVRGVWYTPEPVVDFIIRAVDDVLKTDFGIADGLADNRKITIDWDTGQRGLNKDGSLSKSLETVKEKRNVHKVQILDPAAGTGTFLAQAIKHIAPRIQAAAPGLWAGYVEKDLIPRLHGFELLMASYAMCHMKLEMTLRDHGYEPTKTPPRVSVYLTNSLEEGEAANQTLPFAQWLSNEVKDANKVKRDMPIMCVIGNPPYRGESTNKGAWIMGLMEAYKKEPGGYEKLKERNPKWINDDYVKFIRMSESMIEKNGEGVLGFITNHGYLDNPTFRGMRWHLLKTFDKIYVLDLHGNSKKKEVCPDGSADKNVFDIQQGVAIIIGVKTKPTIVGDKRKKGEDIPLAQVLHADLWGTRKSKYEALWSCSLDSVKWAELELRGPENVFRIQDWKLKDSYDSGIYLPHLMPSSGPGIVTARDALTIDMDKSALWSRVQEFTIAEPEYLRLKYRLGADVQDWSVRRAKSDVTENFSEQNLVRIAYRPFDIRWTYFTGNSNGFHCRPRGGFTEHLARHQNLALAIPKQTKDSVGGLVTKFASGHKIYSAYDINTLFPLYLYPEENDLDQTRRLNFDNELHRKLRKLAAHPDKGEPDELAIFDYIYGVLHCPAYRNTFAEFLKSDFPRIPWPDSPHIFWDVAAKGGQLRRVHLMEDSAVGATSFPFNGIGNNVVGKPRFEGGRVWINETQGFDDAPPVSWDFHIGGYQPAQKWLKDRKGRELSFDDVRHYQKILKALSETDRIMKSINMPL